MGNAKQSGKKANGKAGPDRVRPGLADKRSDHGLPRRPQPAEIVAARLVVVGGSSLRGGTRVETEVRSSSPQASRPGSPLLDLPLLGPCPPMLRDRGTLGGIYGAAGEIPVVDGADRGHDHLPAADAVLAVPQAEDVAEFVGEVFVDGTAGAKPAACVAGRTIEDDPSSEDGGTMTVTGAPSLELNGVVAVALAFYQEVRELVSVTWTGFPQRDGVFDDIVRNGLVEVEANPGSESERCLVPVTDLAGAPVLGMGERGGDGGYQGRGYDVWFPHVRAPF